jgi:hypothetical protein
MRERRDARCPAPRRAARGSVTPMPRCEMFACRRFFAIFAADAARLRRRLSAAATPKYAAQRFDAAR